MQTIVIVDVGLGNLRSVQKAVERAAADRGIACQVPLTGDPDAIARADKVIMPGQGAFRDCAAAIGRGVGEALRGQIAAGVPYLGICLGLQALFDRSEEAPGMPGLSVYRGSVDRLADGASDPESGLPVKIPHMGWNRLEMHGERRGPLSVFDRDPPFVYFVHSYHAVPTDVSLVAATTTHGPYTVTAAVQRDNVTATQFHPEKSQDAGLLFLGAFIAL